MNSTPILFGIETEYGIARDGVEDLDVVAESIALVRSAMEPDVRMRWDYEAENPHHGDRGFDVPELRQDFDEADYFEQDTHRELTFAEIKSDLALGNGARFYNDHAHPEYCTPECSTLAELVAHDRAGERVVMACAQRLSKARCNEFLCPRGRGFGNRINVLSGGSGWRVCLSRKNLRVRCRLGHCGRLTLCATPFPFAFSAPFRG